MEQIAKAEPARRQGESLEQVAQRFRHWRETRIRGEHIPPDLWAAAVGLAKAHSLERIAHELRVEHGGLKRRVERAGVVARGVKLDTQFVELFAAPAVITAGMRECVVELENARGAKMRVELNGNGIAGLAGLCSAFWGAA
jgi:hypothetical protein